MNITLGIVLFFSGALVGTFLTAIIVASKGN